MELQDYWTVTSDLLTYFATYSPIQTLAYLRSPFFGAYVYTVDYFISEHRGGYYLPLEADSEKATDIPEVGFESRNLIPKVSYVLSIHPTSATKYGEISGKNSIRYINVPAEFKGPFLPITCCGFLCFFFLQENLKVSSGMHSSEMLF